MNDEDATLSGAGHDHGAASNLKVAFLLNLGFTILEIFGGLWTNSIAILTDALHDAGDTSSLGLAWYFERISERGRTPQHTYGYTRFRLLGGLITGIVLIVGLGFILWKASGRLLNPEPVNAPGMLALAAVGLAVNGYAVLRTRKGSSLTEKIVSWHLLEDTLGWGAVLIGAGVMILWDVPVVDPLLSIGISLFVLWNVGRNLKRVMRVFLQAIPESFDTVRFETKVKEFPKTAGVHHVHVWTLDGENHVLTAHIVMSRDTSRKEIVTLKRQVRAELPEDAFAHITLDVELEGEECGARMPEQSG